MVSYAVLPPEVNSARMYAGAGASPMLTAAASWDRLAAMLGSAASSYQTVVSQLAGGSWRGPASTAMAASAQPYVQWLSATAARATQAAGQARAAAAAYEAAFAATVPPAVVEANRAQLQLLMAHNVMGQNAAAIAANQAEYSQMWAQDAAAMHGYAANSAAATGSLSPFSPAPQTSKSNGSTTPAAPLTSSAPAAPAAPGASSGAAAPAGPLTTMANSIATNPLLTSFNALESSVVGNWWFNYFLGAGVLEFVQYMLFTPAWVGAATAATSYAASIGMVPAAGLISTATAGGLPATLANSVAMASASAGSSAASFGPISAATGGAVRLGELAVPALWAGPAQRGGSAAPMSASGGLSALPAAAADAATAGRGRGIPAIVGIVNAPRSGRSRVRAGSAKTAHHDVPEDSADRSGKYRSALVASVQEAFDARDELTKLRRAVAEMAVQRDALEHAAVSMAEEGTRKC